MTRVGGSSGIVGIIWGGVTLMMRDKSSAGKRCDVTSRRCSIIAEPVTSSVVRGNAKHSFIGHTIVGDFDMVKKKFGTQRKSEMTFSERVVKIVLLIPKGKVTTYGRIARAAGGGAMASQSITTILGKAWDTGEKDIPFHRIVYADGKVWTDDTHRKKRLKKYNEEGIELDKNNRVVDFYDKLFLDEY
jgi:methylated-DNA-protein-cysteine methyltransferase-like protein